MIRRVPSRHRHQSIAPERDRGAFNRLVLLLFAGLVLATGFIYAGGRHFEALKLGYDTEKLRSELETVRAEQRRLLLTREAAASPARLDRAARQLGMQPLQPAQIDPLKLNGAKTSTAETSQHNERNVTATDREQKDRQQIRIR